MKTKNNTRTKKFKLINISLFIILALSMLTLAIDITGLVQYVDTPLAANLVNAGSTITFNAEWTTGNYSALLFCKESTCTDCWYSLTTQASETSGCWCINNSLSGNTTSGGTCTYQTTHTRPLLHRSLLLLHSVNHVLFYKLYDIAYNANQLPQHPVYLYLLIL